MGWASRPRITRPGWRGALVGALSMAAALVAQWLLMQATDGESPYIPYSFGDWFIRRTPGDLATEAIERFGSNAREYIVLGMAVAAVAVGSALGAIWRWSGPGLAAVATIVGAWIQPIPPAVWMTAFAAIVAAAAAALVVLCDERGRALGEVPPSRQRRTLVLGGFAAATGLAIAAGLSALAITASVRRWGPDPEGEPVQATHRLTIPSTVEFEAAAEGLSPLITVPADHYVIDINLDRPRVDSGSWTLMVHGEVEHTLELGFDELAALGLVERAIYLQCISNFVGGGLMGNATWYVVPITDVLQLARPATTARTIVARAYDGYHESYEIGQAGDIFVALAMGGFEIPDDHGSPVRLLHPGHYGMRSIKWLTSLELVGDERAEHEGYWQERGWDDEAPLRLGSRIDRPGGGDAPSGSLVVAGVAWGPAPVTGVEVSVDDGATWPHLAELEPPVDDRAWTRWKAVLELPSGSYDVRSRAISGDEVQDSTWRDPHPSGSSGLDLRVIKIR